MNAVHERLREVRRLEAFYSGEQRPLEATAVEWAKYGRILKWLDQVYQTHLTALEKLGEIHRSRSEVPHEHDALEVFLTRIASRQGSDIRRKKHGVGQRVSSHAGQCS